jgi:hypothetical protein
MLSLPPTARASRRRISSAVLRMAGIALPTSALGSQVRKPNRSVLISPSLALRTEVQSVHPREGEHPPLVIGREPHRHFFAVNRVVFRKGCERD